MGITETVYNLAGPFATGAIVLEGLAMLTLLTAIFSHNPIPKAASAESFFKAGVRTRNAAFLMLVFIFLAASKGATVGGADPLVSISTVCESFAYMSVFIFAAYIVLSVLSGIKRNTNPAVKDALTRAGRSATWSIVIGYALAYFLNIQ